MGPPLQKVNYLFVGNLVLFNPDRKLKPKTVTPMLVNAIFLFLFLVIGIIFYYHGF